MSQEKGSGERRVFEGEVRLGITDGDGPWGEVVDEHWNGIQFFEGAREMILGLDEKRVRITVEVIDDAPATACAHRSGSLRADGWWHCAECGAPGNLVPDDDGQWRIEVLDDAPATERRPR